MEASHFNRNARGKIRPGRSESVSSFTLEKGKPLTLRYRVTLTDLQ